MKINQSLTRSATRQGETINMKCARWAERNINWKTTLEF